MIITLTWWMICLILSCPVLAYMFWPRHGFLAGLFETGIGTIAILVIWLIGVLVK